MIDDRVCVLPNGLLFGRCCDDWVFTFRCQASSPPECVCVCFYFVQRVFWPFRMTYTIWRCHANGWRWSPLHRISKWWWGAGAGGNVCVCALCKTQINTQSSLWTDHTWYTLLASMTLFGNVHRRQLYAMRVIQNSTFTFLDSGEVSAVVWWNVKSTIHDTNKKTTWNRIYTYCLFAYISYNITQILPIRAHPIDMAFCYTINQLQAFGLSGQKHIFPNRAQFSSTARQFAISRNEKWTDLTTKRCEWHIEGELPGGGAPFQTRMRIYTQNNWQGHHRAHKTWAAYITRTHIRAAAPMETIKISERTQHGFNMQ